MAQNIRSKTGEETNAAKDVKCILFNVNAIRENLKVIEKIATKPDTRHRERESGRGDHSEDQSSVTPEMYAKCVKPLSTPHLVDRPSVAASDALLDAEHVRQRCVNTGLNSNCDPNAHQYVCRERHCLCRCYACHWQYYLMCAPMPSPKCESRPSEPTHPFVNNKSATHEMPLSKCDTSVNSWFAQKARISLTKSGTKMYGKSESSAKHRSHPIGARQSRNMSSSAVSSSAVIDRSVAQPSIESWDEDVVDQTIAYNYVIPALMESDSSDDNEDGDVKPLTIKSQIEIQGMKPEERKEYYARLLAKIKERIELKESVKSKSGEFEGQASITSEPMLNVKSESIDSPLTEVRKPRIVPTFGIGRGIVPNTSRRMVGQQSDSEKPSMDSNTANKREKSEGSTSISEPKRRSPEIPF